MVYIKTEVFWLCQVIKCYKIQVPRSDFRWANLPLAATHSSGSDLSDTPIWPWTHILSHFFIRNQSKNMLMKSTVSPHWRCSKHMSLGGVSRGHFGTDSATILSALPWHSASGLGAQSVLFLGLRFPWCNTFLYTLFTFLPVQHATPNSPRTPDCDKTLEIAPDNGKALWLV